MDTKPSSNYHSDVVRSFNAEASGSSAEAAPATDLSEGGLIAAARNETGLHYFGDDKFLPALRVFLTSLENEAQLTPFGRLYTRSSTIESLKNRLWTNACLQARPEILDRRIEAPIIIIGHHRSGTTRLHRMLAADTRLRFLKTWESLNPAPRLGHPDLGKANRFREVADGIGQMDIIYPGFLDAHPMHADWPEEEMLLQRHCFCSASMFFAYNNPSYYQWFKECDKAADYDYVANLLKLLSWSNNEAGDQRWVLKNPTHMMDLDVLMKTFPDAKLVFIHRDPIKTAGSLMSMRWLFAVQLTDQPLRAALRDMSLDLCETMARRCMARRDAVVPASQRIDVFYEEMNRNWRAVVRRIYEFSGMELTREAEQSIGDWLASSEKENRHAGHRYSLEDFGTTADEIDERMAFYRQWLSIPYERQAKPI